MFGAASFDADIKPNPPRTKLYLVTNEITVYGLRNVLYDDWESQNLFLELIEAFQALLEAPNFLCLYLRQIKRKQLRGLESVSCVHSSHHH